MAFVILVRLNSQGGEKHGSKDQIKKNGSEEGSFL